MTPVAWWPSVKAWRIVNEYAGTLYYPVHGVSAPRRWTMTPRLLAVEYLVYRVDSVLERNRDNDLEVTRTPDYGRLHQLKALFRLLLRGLGCWSPVTAARLDQGEAFARLENALTARGTADEEDLRALAELRPADVRLLHAMIEAMLGRPHDPSLHAALHPAEVLADVANDLEHYHRDVAEGTVNVYAGFVRRYGADGPDRVRRLIESCEADLRARLTALPAARAEVVRRQCEALLRDRLRTLPTPVAEGPVA